MPSRTEIDLIWAGDATFAEQAATIDEKVNEVLALGRPE